MKFEIKYSDEFYKKLLIFFPDQPTELINFIEQQLSYAPIDHPNKRVKEIQKESAEYLLSYKYYRIPFIIKQNTIFVTSLYNQNV